MGINRSSSSALDGSQPKTVDEAAAGSDRFGRAVHSANEMPSAAALPMVPSPMMTAAYARPAQAPVAPRSTAVGVDPKQRLETMFREHHALIWRTLRRLGCSKDAASDATQQAYLIAAERLDSIRLGCERAYLFSTAINLSRTKVRRERRCDLEEDMDSRISPRGQAETLTQQQYARQLLDQVLAKMDEDLVTVFSLYEIEGLTTREVADALEIPMGTVASRLRRAREAFRGEAERLETVVGRADA